MVGFIEKAVPQSGTNQDTEETVDVERSEEFVLDFLLLIQAFHHEKGQYDSDGPHQPVPSHRQRTQSECHEVWIPDDI